MSFKKVVLSSRFFILHDTEANWVNMTSFIPEKGEPVVYDVDEDYNYERLKIGDGVRNVNELPFLENTGPAGYTPKKGVDYFTENDIAEMVSAVIAALPVYNGEVESV